MDAPVTALIMIGCFMYVIAGWHDSVDTSTGDSVTRWYVIICKHKNVLDKMTAMCAAVGRAMPDVHAPSDSCAHVGFAYVLPLASRPCCESLVARSDA